MSVHLYHRGGGPGSLSDDPAERERQLHELVDELCVEDFPRPDYEHSSISVGHDGGWFIAAYMSGVVVLGHLRKAVEKRYLYGLPKEELADLFLALADQRMDGVLVKDWSEDLEAVRGRGSFYLRANSPGMTDLHRAVLKEDVDWLRAEVEAGTDPSVADELGQTPLHLAAICGYPEICQLLLQVGANPLAEDQGGVLPWKYATDHEYLDEEAEATLIAMLRPKDEE